MEISDATPSDITSVPYKFYSSCFSDYWSRSYCHSTTLKSLFVIKKLTKT